MGMVTQGSQSLALGLATPAASQLGERLRPPDDQSGEGQAGDFAILRHL